MRPESYRPGWCRKPERWWPCPAQIVTVTMYWMLSLWSRGQRDHLGDLRSALSGAITAAVRTREFRIGGGRVLLRRTEGVLGGKSPLRVPKVYTVKESPLLGVYNVGD